MKYLYIVIFSSICLHLHAQDPMYQRVYPYLNESLINGAIESKSDGFFMAAWLNDDEDNRDKIHLTEHSLKGSVDWNFNYYVENLESMGLNMDLYTESKTQVILTFQGLTESEDERHVFVVQIDSLGNPTWRRNFVDFGTDLSENNVQVISNQNEGFVYAGNATDENNQTSLLLTSLDTLGNNIWSFRYSVENDNYFAAMDTTIIDSSLVVTGDLGDHNLYISEIAQTGSVKWARSFQFENTIGFDNTVEDIYAGVDSTYTIVGNAFNDDLNRINYILKVDIEGNVLWARSLDFGNNLPNERNQHVVIDDAGNSLVMGRFIQADTVETFEYVVSLDTAGTLNWVNIYNENQSQAASLEMGELKAGDFERHRSGYLFSATSTDFDSENNRSLVVATDPLGQARCHEVSTVVVDTLNVTVDVIDFTLEEYSEVDSMLLIVDTIPSYSLPTVTLQDTMFCPSDPIFHILDAEHPDAISYSWGSGETTPQITVTEEGEFTVEVTFDTLTCYTLCDTATVSRIMVPSVEFNVDPSIWCETEEFIITANPIPGQPPYDFTWSTEETTQTIQGGLGTYGLTIIDGCQEIVDTALVIGINNIPMPDAPVLDWDRARFCETGEIVVFIVNEATGMYEDIVWNTGEQDVTEILVPDFGTYSVTAVTCNQETMGTINVMELPALIGDISQSMVDCATVLTADASGGVMPYTYLWNTGDDVESIAVLIDGAFAVTVTDLCGDVITFGTTVTQEMQIEVLISQQTSEGNCAPRLITEVIGGTEPFTYAWSNGETTERIIPSADGIFTVTITDACGLTDEEDSENITLEEFIEPSFSNSCDGILEITLANPEIYSSFVWSTGQTSVSINPATTEGLSITVVDLCGREREFPAGVGDTPEFPNIFFPVSNDPDFVLNRRFRAFIGCTDGISDYELKVYNRWGKKMYETTNINEGWNGRVNNDDPNFEPNGVYMYHASWRNVADNSEGFAEGDVTLYISP